MALVKMALYIIQRVKIVELFFENACLVKTVVLKKKCLVKPILKLVDTLAFEQRKSTNNSWETFRSTPSRYLVSIIVNTDLLNQIGLYSLENASRQAFTAKIYWLLSSDNWFFGVNGIILNIEHVGIENKIWWSSYFKKRELITKIMGLTPFDYFWLCKKSCP